jgi:recombination protein RecA
MWEAASECLRRTKSENYHPPLPRQIAMHSKSAALRLHVESALAGRIASPFRQLHIELPCTVPAGVPVLDEATGGLPRGCLTEMYGPPFSGKTSVLQSALATRMANAETCALVDAQDSFDPVCAEAAGVSLRQLLWIRCKNLDHAFRSVDFLLNGGGFGMVAMDLSDAPPRLVRQIPLNVWFRLRRSVENTSTILLVLSRESNAKTCASLVLRLEKEAAAWSVRERAQPSRVLHTPACMLDGWSTCGEVIRSHVRRKTLHFLNRSQSARNFSNGVIRFELQANRFSADLSQESRFVPSKKEGRKNPG